MTYEEKWALEQQLVEERAAKELAQRLEAEAIQHRLDYAKQLLKVTAERDQAFEYIKMLEGKIAGTLDIDITVVSTRPPAKPRQNPFFHLLKRIQNMW